LNILSTSTKKGSVPPKRYLQILDLYIYFVRRTRERLD